VLTALEAHKRVLDREKRPRAGVMITVAEAQLVAQRAQDADDARHAQNIANKIDETLRRWSTKGFIGGDLPESVIMLETREGIITKIQEILDPAGWTLTKESDNWLVAPKEIHDCHPGCDCLEARRRRRKNQ